MTIHDLDRIEKASIREFVTAAARSGLFAGGKVLDYGCGKHPYRDVIEDGDGVYVGFDAPWFPGSVFDGEGDEFPVLPLGSWSAILCTQVLQFVPDVGELMERWRLMLTPGAHIVVTYPTAWPVLRDELWRFTKIGMEKLVTDAGFRVVRHEMRAALPFDGFEIPVGYGLVAAA